jgi:hypothetical protein
MPKLTFITSKRIRSNLLEFEAVNERICGFDMKGRFRNLRIIPARAQTEEKEEDETEAFYDNLESAYSRAPRYDILLVIGDFSAKLGKEIVQRQVTGKYSLHYVTSEKGVMHMEFAVGNKSVIKSKVFPHKRIHLGTWRMPDSEVLSQRVHVLVAARHSSQ